MAAQLTPKIALATLSAWLLSLPACAKTSDPSREAVSLRVAGFVEAAGIT
jgi:hypothetical protein